jgi:hypothetical protein
MPRTTSLSLLSLLALFTLTEAASSDIKKAPQKSAVRPPRTVVAQPDKIKVSKLEATGSGAKKTITLEVKNVSNDAALWVPWQLVVKSGGDRYLGLGTIDSLNGGQSVTLTFDYVPPAGNSTLEASIDRAHKVETDSAMWPSNTKSVTLTGAAPTSGTQVVPFQPAQASGVTHGYVPRPGMTGCTHTTGTNGPSITVNFTCTAQGAGTLTLLDGYTLKNGYALNSISFGQLGGGSVVPLSLPKAGGTAATMTFSTGGSPGQAPVVFATLEVVGPVGQNP